jgi:serine/threonine protein kinase
MEKACPECGRVSVGAFEEAPALNLDPDDRYSELDIIGTGGMSTVYKVHDQELDEIIAIKALHPERQKRWQDITRFKAELKLARRINHPNVAHLYDIFLWKGQLAISQEYIEGRSLLDEIIDSGPLPVRRVVHYLRYICSAINAAHRIGVIHGDLKPANIIIDKLDRPRIVDFGIASLAGRYSSADRRGSIGSPHYMAPEGLRPGTRLSSLSDIYSLGVTLYVMVTGEVPFMAETVKEIFEAHKKKKPEPPSRHNSKVPPVVDKVILRCLEKEPESRYSTGTDVYTDFRGGLLDAKEAVLAVEETIRSGLAGKKGRVLVTDDDESVRGLIKAYLESLGLEVETAKDGVEGLKKAEKGGFNLIILDIKMPLMNGRQVLRYLKSKPETRDMPVVMLTGLADPEEYVRAKEAGAEVFLNKPIAPDILGLLVEKYIT